MWSLEILVNFTVLARCILHSEKTTQKKVSDFKLFITPKVNCAMKPKNL